MKNTDRPIHQDYLQDKRGNIFQVITSSHPQERVIALLRYVPAQDPTDPNAIWQPQSGRIKGIRYHRQLEAYNVSKARSNVDFVETTLPSYVLSDSIYGVPMIAVPRTMIEVYYQPRQRLGEILGSDETELDEFEVAAKHIANALRDHLGIESDQVGITGSILWRAQHRYSDIDIVIYGLENKSRFVTRYQELYLADPKITGLTEQWTQEFAKSLQEKSGLPFEECYKYILRKPWLTLYHEPRIRQQPIQVGIYFAPTQDEVEQVYRPYGQEWYKSVGTVTVEAEITDDLLSLYYPAIYKISVEAVTELASKETLAAHPSEIKRIFLFEGAISGYAFTGGRVRIRGMLQRVTSSENDGFYQILIGTTENHSREYIQLLDRNPRINSPLSL